MERILEKVLFGSRWLLAPVYLGMSLILVALGVKFFMGIYHVAIGLLHEQESELVLQLLSLIDLVLVASLIVMVMFSGYENFVSRMDTGSDESLSWLGKLDAGTLKLKVAASIVAISSIHLLEKFMQVNEISGDKLFWYVCIHLTFVVSALLMGVLDRIAFAAHREH